MWQADMENECNILYLYEFLCQIAVCLLVLLLLHSRGLQSAYASALSFHAFRQIPLRPSEFGD